MKYIKTYEKLRLGNQKDLNNALLKYCRVKESLQLIRSLLYKGADINCKDLQGLTPLLIASNSRFYSAVKLLIEKGADVNATDSYGNNAIIFLTITEKIGNKIRECVDLLIEKDIDLTQSNKNTRRDVFSIGGKLITNYIKEKYPEKYEEYLLKKDAEKYNL